MRLNERLRCNARITALCRLFEAFRREVVNPNIRVADRRVEGEREFGLILVKGKSADNALAGQLYHLRSVVDDGYQRLATGLVMPQIQLRKAFAVDGICDVA